MPQALAFREKNTRKWFQNSNGCFLKNVAKCSDATEATTAATLNHIVHHPSSAAAPPTMQFHAATRDASTKEFSAPSRRARSSLSPNRSQAPQF